MHLGQMISFGKIVIGFAISGFDSGAGVGLLSAPSELAELLEEAEGLADSVAAES